MNAPINNVLSLLKSGKIDRQQAKRLINKINQMANPANNITDESTKYFSSMKSSDIAIIGMSGIFPGVSSVDEFWESLVANRCSVTEVPENRWNWHHTSDTIYCRWGGFLNDVDKFDAPFFNTSPLESEGMDPQQRLFLQEAYHAFEDAGYSEHRLNNELCGVYVGTMHNDYASLLSGNHESKPDVYEMTGNHSSILGARISYYLNLKGPCITLDTACSSSLVATHMACQAMANGDIDLALVGGVTLYLDPNTYEMMCKAHMLSSTGRCNTFDDDADGFVPSEGCVAVVLKPLAKAESDGDRIYGVINGSAVNQDGRTNGITAPSGLSQKDLITRLYERNRINPENISYVETHGTGTKLGDPIEVESLTEAFRKFTNKELYCAIGSVKTNVGHTSAAAGLTSLVKVLKSFENDLIPATINYTKCNSHINLEHSPFYVANRNLPWEEQPGHPRAAAVSSFGFGGTNAHLVVSDYRVPHRPACEPEYRLFPFSSKTTASLTVYLKNFISWLKQKKHIDLRDIAFTLGCGRTHYDKRAAVVANSPEQLIKLLLIKVVELKGGISADSAIGEDTEFNSEVSEKQKHLQSLAVQYCAGRDIGFDKQSCLSGGKIVSLPQYVFDKKSYWSERIKPNTKGFIENGRAEFSDTVSITVNRKQRFIRDHLIDGESIIPIAFYINWINSLTSNNRLHGIGDINALRPVKVTDSNVTLILEYQQGNEFNIYVSEDREKPVVRGHFADPIDIDDSTIDVSSTESALPNWVGSEVFYRTYVPSFIQYGDSFRCIKEIKYSESEFLAQVVSTSDDAEDRSSACLIDAMLHTVLCLNKKDEYLPTRIEGVLLNNMAGRLFYIHGRKKDGGDTESNELSYGLNIYSSKGEFAGCIQKLRLIKKAGAYSAEHEHPFW